MEDKKETKAKEEERKRIGDGGCKKTRGRQKPQSEKESEGSRGKERRTTARDGGGQTKECGELAGKGG